MKAGLLADIILGESPHLKGLVRHFNLLVLNPSGKITGFNKHFTRNSGKSENQLIHQNFAKLFDCDEGKAELLLCVKRALKGQPGSISFGLMESNVTFKGVILPVYDSGNFPANLILITKEEHTTVVSDLELDDFWNLASKMMEEVGVSTHDPIIIEKPKNPNILLIEDRKGLIAKLFQSLIKSKQNVTLAPTSEAALLMAESLRPLVVITTAVPIGQNPIAAVADELKQKYNSSTIYLSTNGNEIRIEDGWLDIHIKNQPDSIRKILDLINQLYW
jgi:hypothetical protein